MKRHEGSYWEVRSLDGTHGLALPFDADNLYACRQAIYASNEKAKRLGYDTVQWLICHVEWYRYFDKDGNFVKSETLTQAIEKYPE